MHQKEHQRVNYTTENEERKYKLDGSICQIAIVVVVVARPYYYYYYYYCKIASATNISLLVVAYRLQHSLLTVTVCQEMVNTRLFHMSTSRCAGSCV